MSLPWIDAHHHLWDPAVRPQTWMDPSWPINRPFDADDLRSAIEGTPVGCTVAVQTVSDTAETVDLLETAATDPLIGAVIGWLDLGTDIGLQLDRLARTGAADLLVAVRHQAEDEPDPAWLSRETVAASVRMLGRRGLAYDLLIRPHQLAAAVDLARSSDGTTKLVLDHCAKPPVGRDLRSWTRSIQALAGYEHVACKLSGLVTEAQSMRWSLPDLMQVFDVVLDCFGPRRMMFGSDWPVCLLAATYDEVAEAACSMTAELSPSERDQVFSGTARAWYGLP